MSHATAIDELQRQMDRTIASLAEVEAREKLIRKHLRQARLRSTYLQYAKSLRAPAQIYSLWNVGVQVVSAAVGAAILFTLLALFGAPMGLLVLGAILGALSFFGGVTIGLRHPPSESLPGRLAEAEAEIRQLQSELAPLTEQTNQLRNEVAAARNSITELKEEDRQERERLLQREWKTMRDAEWVSYVAQVCQFLGAHVKHTGSTEPGVDLVVKYGGYRIAVRAQGHQHRVSNKPVEKVLAGMGHYECNRAAVITNSRFTKYAKEFAEHHSCILVGHDEFEAFVMGSNLELFE